MFRVRQGEVSKAGRQAAIMDQFVHNIMVHFHGVVTEEENMMIVLEYMPKGGLLNHLLKIKSQ